ncbi:hypothetical protein [Paracoccus saliphilus]|nr:hypothetical protein [Paracoccus saliphilus]
MNDNNVKTGDGKNDLWRALFSFVNKADAVVKDGEYDDEIRNA